MDGDGEGQIIDTQPGREAPREWLPINEVDRPIPLPWYQEVVGTGIAMNERKPMVVAGARDHRWRVVRVERPHGSRPVRFQLLGELLEDGPDTRCSEGNKTLNVLGIGERPVRFGKSLRAPPSCMHG